MNFRNEEHKIKCHLFLRSFNLPPLGLKFYPGSAEQIFLQLKLFCKEKMGHVVIVPRRAMCSPVIEPLGFRPTISPFL